MHFPSRQVIGMSVQDKYEFMESLDWWSLLNWSTWELLNIFLTSS